MPKSATPLLLGLTILVAGCAPRDDAESTREDPSVTADSLLALVNASAAAASYPAARDAAVLLMNEYPTSPQSDSARELLPLLRLAADSVEAAQRHATILAASERKWSYSVDDDEMTGRRTRTAFLSSENTVSFDFPYEGAQNGSLIVRDHPTHGLNVIVSIREGQFLCHSYEDCRIRIRFDEAAPEYWNAVGPSDHSTTSIFIRGASRFLQRMRRAKLVRIQVPVYQEGNPIFEFDVRGFSYNRFTR